MQFSAPLLDFQKLLQRVMPAIPPKSTLPVLEHLNFKISDGNLTVIATDQDITIMSSMPVSMPMDLEDVNQNKEFSVLVPARKINDIIKALEPKGKFDFVCDLDNFEINIKTEKGKYNMKGLDPNEYLDLPELFESQKPDIEKLNELPEDAFTAVFTETDLRRLAERAVFAVSTDEFRPAMTGVLFQFRKSYVNAVATDSYRLARATSFADKFLYPEDYDLIIPARMVDMLKKVDAQTLMSLIESNNKVTHVRFDFGSTVIISRIINEKFPPYEAVIPVDNNLIVNIDLKELLSATKRVSIFANTVSKQVKMHIMDNLLTLHSEDEDSGYQGSEDVACEYNGPEINIAFNFKFLEEVLQNIPSDETENNVIRMFFSELNKPVLLKPIAENDTLLMLIMPVRTHTGN